MDFSYNDGNDDNQVLKTRTYQFYNFINSLISKNINEYELTQSRTARITANNQLGYYNSFQANKLSLGIGNWDDASEDEIVASVKKIINFNSEEKNTQLLNQHKYIDGFSSERILHQINTI